MARVILDRPATAKKVLPDCQCGFRGGCDTIDMIFSARQLQGKSKGHHMSLYGVFINLTKALDSVDQEDLWKILRRYGCPEKIVRLIKSFHEGMMACVLGSGSAAEGFPVTNGTKQGCVLAPTLFSVLLTAILHDAFKDLDNGVAIEFRFDGSIFNLRRLHQNPRYLCH